MIAPDMPPVWRQFFRPPQPPCESPRKCAGSPAGAPLPRDEPNQIIDELSP